jgi:hypothetical protein
MDGEAVVLGADGKSNFDRLHSRKHDAEVQFYAFDILVAVDDDERRWFPVMPFVFAVTAGIGFASANITDVMLERGNARRQQSRRRVTIWPTP